MITKQTVAKQLLAYMQHEITQKTLVNWAENAIMEGDFEDNEADILTEIIGKICLTDVNNFGLLWEDCNEMMQKLGYHIKVEAVLLAA
jgi:hypothetical protein